MEQKPIDKLSIKFKLESFGKPLSHSDETLDTRRTSLTNQLTRVKVDGRWYGSAMKIPAIAHGTVDQGGSICGLEKNLEEFGKVRTRSTSPDLSALSPHMERGTHWRVKYLEYHADFGYRL